MIDLMIFVPLAVIGLLLIGGSSPRTTGILRSPLITMPWLSKITGGVCLSAALAQQIYAWGIEVGIIRGLLLLSLVGVAAVVVLSGFAILRRRAASTLCS